MLERGRGRGKIIRAAQNRLDLRQQHVQIKGLGDEIISAHIHGHDDIHIVRCRGNEHDRHVRHAPQLLTPVVAVIKRERDVEQHKLRIERRALGEHVAEILRAAHVKAPRRQVLLQRGGDGRVILHDKNPIAVQNDLPPIKAVPSAVNVIIITEKQLVVI